MRKLPVHIKGDTHIGFSVQIKVNGVYIDFTGCAIRLQFRYGEKKGTPASKVFTIGDGIVLTTTTKITCLQNKVIDFKAGPWYFDIEIQFPDGRVRTYFQAILPIEQDVTPST